MKTKALKWGNGLAIRIPKRLAEEAGLRPSTDVEVILEKGKLHVAPVRVQWRLDELVSKITKRNRHVEVELDSDLPT
jgi:antitoxin component of MazEF toxin-antitoxin module